MKGFLVWICAVACALLFIQLAPGHAQTELREYRDREYGYSFKYPSGWKMESLPEGETNRDIRLMLQGPGGSSFMVVVDKTKEILRKSDFEDKAERTRRVGEMMEQTIGQIYRSISEGIKAENMKVGERRDLSNDFGIKFYIATLHTMKQGKPIIVAGIHCFPFDKDYSINFTMTTFWDPAATQENQTLTAVFNTFHLIGEPPPDGSPANPSADKSDTSESR